jgi:hypothetical protein
MRRFLPILCFACACIPCLPAPRPKHETISGRVVAYSGFPACLNGNGYWSIIIRVQQPKDSNSGFIRVEFTLPCKESPEWVSTQPLNQKFRLIRQKSCDAVLTRSVPSEPPQNIDSPIWNYLPGVEHETLPFGQILPCYRSIDLPLAPVL